MLNVAIERALEEQPAVPAMLFISEIRSEITTTPASAFVTEGEAGVAVVLLSAPAIANICTPANNTRATSNRIQLNFPSILMAMVSLRSANSGSSDSTCEVSGLYFSSERGNHGPMKNACLRSMRFLLLGSLFVLSFAALSSTNKVQASTGKLGNEFDYFSDATLTHQVGFVIFCRNGQVIRSGQMTQFVKVQPAGC